MWVKWGNGVGNVGVLFGLWGIWFWFWDVRGCNWEFGGVYFWVSVQKDYPGDPGNSGAFSAVFSTPISTKNSNFLALLFSGYNNIVERKHRHRTERGGTKNQRFLGVINRCYNSLVDTDKQSTRQKVQVNAFASYPVRIFPTGTRYKLDLLDLSTLMD